MASEEHKRLEAPSMMVQQAIDQAAGTGMLTEDGSNLMVTAWIACVAFMDKDGEPGMLTLALDGLAFWQVKGLLVEGLDSVRAQQGL